MIDRSGREVFEFNAPRGPYPGVVESESISSFVGLAVMFIVSVAPTVLALYYDIPILFPH